MDVYRITKWVKHVGILAGFRKTLESHNIPYVIIRRSLEYALFRKIWQASSVEIRDETEELSSILERGNYALISRFGVTDEDLGIKNEKRRSRKLK